MVSNAEQVRELIHDDEPLIAPGVFDALTARIVEDIGFDAVYLGGYATGASTAHTEPITTMTEMCWRAREITSNINIPLIVDGDAGFGNAPHAYRTAKEYAKSGIAGFHIEDQVYPKRLHYHAGINRITNIEEVEHKLEAASEALEDYNEDAVLIGRTDAARGQRREEEGESIETGVERANRFLDAGAEVAQVFPMNIEELEHAVNHVEGPLKVTVSKSNDPCPTVEELRDIGVALAVYPTDATAAAAKAVSNIYTDLWETGETSITSEEAAESREYVEEVIGLPRYYEIEEREGKK